MKVTGQGIARLIAQPDAAHRAALFFGPNRSRVAEAVDQAVKALLGANADPFALTRLSEDDVRKDKALLCDELSAQSLLGGARIVRLRCDGDSAHESVAAAMALLDQTPGAAFLIIEGGDLAGKSKVRAACEASKSCGVVVFYEDTADDIASYAMEILRQGGVKLDEAAKETALAALPLDRGAARAEMEKLVLYAHGLTRPLQEDEVLALAGDPGEAELDLAQLSALEGNGGAALEALNRVDGGGVSAIKGMERRLLRLMEAHALIREGLSPQDAGKRLRPPVFWKEQDRFAAQLRAWTPALIQRGLSACWNAELSAKSAGAPQGQIAGQLYLGLAKLIARERRRA